MQLTIREKLENECSEIDSGVWGHFLVLYTGFVLGGGGCASSETLLSTLVLYIHNHCLRACSTDEHVFWGTFFYYTVHTYPIALVLISHCTSTDIPLCMR